MNFHQSEILSQVAKYLLRPLGEDDDDLELNYLLDRNIQVAIATVDEIFDQRPELSLDPFLISTQSSGTVRLPHTHKSIGAKKTEHPPKQHYCLSVVEKPVEIEENLIPPRISTKKLMKRRDF